MSNLGAILSNSFVKAVRRGAWNGAGAFVVVELDEEVEYRRNLARASHVWLWTAFRGAEHRKILLASIASAQKSYN
jgi:hypothetical protein